MNCLQILRIGSPNNANFIKNHLTICKTQQGVLSVLCNILLSISRTQVLWTRVQFSVQGLHLKTPFFCIYFFFAKCKVPCEIAAGVCMETQNGGTTRASTGPGTNNPRQDLRVHSDCMWQIPPCDQAPRPGTTLTPSSPPSPNIRISDHPPPSVRDLAVAPRSLLPVPRSLLGF